MKKSMWIKLLMAVLVAGLFLTVSCSKKVVNPEPVTIEKKDDSGAENKMGDTDTTTTTVKDGTENGPADPGPTKEDIEKQERLAKEAAALKRFENTDVHFKYDSSELSSMAKMILSDKADWMRANSGAFVTIEGHCDERGTTEYNLALGERRANAVKSYMIFLGISADRMGTVSYGEEQPINYGKDESAYRANRRAHFRID